ncbi:hypothetical protein CMUS01_08942 [Colletotrichum musicola]|uniref:Uncharacterized protein n=1 Tax=Colletotrichum musicola TaxID=2175873 RepID=A0A8H6K9M2_9PEZI|nr:hypothetical protein CMUS01_08942 [Colletotrichum musicola]
MCPSRQNRTVSPPGLSPPLVGQGTRRPRSKGTWPAQQTETGPPQTRPDQNTPGQSYLPVLRPGMSGQQEKMSRVRTSPPLDQLVHIDICTLLRLSTPSSAAASQRNLQRNITHRHCASGDDAPKACAARAVPRYTVVPSKLTSGLRFPGSRHATPRGRSTLASSSSSHSRIGYSGITSIRFDSEPPSLYRQVITATPAVFPFPVPGPSTVVKEEEEEVMVVVVVVVVVASSPTSTSTSTDPDHLGMSTSTSTLTFDAWESAAFRSALCLFGTFQWGVVLQVGRHAHAHLHHDDTISSEVSI